MDKDTYSKLFVELWGLNPEGNFEMTKNYVWDVYLASPVKTFKGDVITIQMITQKYKDYLNFRKFEHEGKDPKYIPKEDKKPVPIQPFVQKQMFEQNFQVEWKGRDYYLFGIGPNEDFDKKIREKVKQFKKKLTHGKQEEPTESDKPF